MVRWQISIPPLLLCRCRRQGEGDFIQPDQAWGEQTAPQTTHITSKHAPQQRSAFGLVRLPVCVCVYWWWCYLSLVWSAHFLFQTNTAARGSLGQQWLLSSISNLLCVIMPHRHANTHTSTHTRNVGITIFVRTLHWIPFIFCSFVQQNLFRCSPPFPNSSNSPVHELINGDCFSDGKWTRFLYLLKILLVFLLEEGGTTVKFPWKEEISSVAHRVIAAFRKNTNLKDYTVKPRIDPKQKCNN